MTSTAKHNFQAVGNQSPSNVQRVDHSNYTDLGLPFSNESSAAWRFTQAFQFCLANTHQVIVEGQLTAYIKAETVGINKQRFIHYMLDHGKSLAQL